MLPDGRKYHLDNKLNDLTGRDWTLFIDSVLTTAYPVNGKEGYAHEIRRIHPTPKPPQLMRDIILFFTKENELVFDYFSGVGGTLLGAALCKRFAAGIEINKKYINAYRKAAKSLGLQTFPVICGDCAKILKDRTKINKLCDNREISLCLIDPPYSNMMSKIKTGGDISVYGKKATPFTNSAKDFGNMPRETYLENLKISVENILPHIKYHGHVIIFTKDMQPSKGNLNMLHAEISEKINDIDGLCYKGMRIWADRTTKHYPYGYPFCYVSNQIHQYILIFRKEIH